MPTLVKNSESLDKRETHLNPWYELLTDILPRMGWGEQPEIMAMFPSPMPSEIPFNENGRAWYKLTDEDKVILEEYVHKWKKNNSESLRSKPESRKTQLASLDDTYKQILSAKYLVISCNPVDKMICSTNQPWGSCMSMESSFSGGFSYNIPTIFPAKGMFICYLTKGEYGNYYIKGQQYKTIKMKTRNFLYLLDQNKIGIGRSYPNIGSTWAGLILKEKLLTNAGFSVVTTVEKEGQPARSPHYNESRYRTRYKMKIYRDSSNDQRTIYFDNLNISSSCDTYRLCNGTRGCANSIETNGTTLLEFIDHNYDFDDIYETESVDYEDDYEDD